MNFNKIFSPPTVPMRSMPSSLISSKAFQASSTSACASCGPTWALCFALRVNHLTRSLYYSKVAWSPFHTGTFWLLWLFDAMVSSRKFLSTWSLTSSSVP